MEVRPIDASDQLACAQEPAVVKPQPLKPVAEWEVEGDFDLDEDLSAIALVARRVGIVGSDEASEDGISSVQIFEIKDGKKLVAGETIPILVADKEADIEGIAVEGNRYYILGSHGVSKKKAKVQLSRFNLFRLTVDPTSGRPTSRRDANGIPADLEIASLRDVVKADGLLSPYAEIRLHDNGVNMEGIAVKDGTIYVGFRGPSLEGEVPILSIDAETLFAGAAEDHRTIAVKLGKGLGIRDMAVSREGFLILSGDSGVKPYKQHKSVHELGNPYALHFWDGSGTSVEDLGEIDTGGAKPEGLLLLAESEQAFDLLVIHDSAANGKPTEYRVPKRP